MRSGWARGGTKKAVYPALKRAVAREAFPSCAGAEYTDVPRAPG